MLKKYYKKQIAYQEKKKITRFTNSNSGEDNKFTYYSQTPENLDAAWENRHKPRTLKEYNPKLYSNTTQLNKLLTHAVRRQTAKEFIQEQPSDKRKKYYPHMHRTDTPSNIIKSFIKIEKIKTDKYTAPRMIQARNPYFTMSLGRYTKPMEHAIYCKDKKTRRFNFAKGMNMYEMAVAIIEKSKRINKPVYICVDHKSFDAHVTPEALRLFHRFTQKLNKDKMLAELQKLQIKNRTYTQFGQKFQFKGTVCSGDITTSFSDCIINYYILNHYMKRMKIRNYEIIVNGDDSVIILDQREIYKFKNFQKTMREYNMETKIDQVTHDINEVEFCRMKIRADNDGFPMMVIDPQRQQNVYGMTYKTGTVDYNSYQRDIAYANMSIYRHTARRETFLRLFEHYDQIATQPIMTALKQTDRILMDMMRQDRVTIEHQYRLLPVENVYIKKHTLREQQVYEVDHIYQTIHLVNP